MNNSNEVQAQLLANGIPVMSSVYPPKPIKEHTWLRKFKVGSRADAHYREKLLRGNTKVVNSHVCDMKKLVPLLKSRGIL